MYRFALPVVAFAVAVSSAGAFTITNDTYVDNFVYSGIDGSTGKTVTLDSRFMNYGNGAAIKATSNNGSGNRYPGANSLTRGLFRLPTDFWTALGTGPITKPVIVTYYARNPSLATNDPSQNPHAIYDPTPIPPTGATYTYRQLELHPLLQPFNAGGGGNGGSTSAGATNTALGPTTSAGTNGTDWFSAGVVAGVAAPWATPGGTFDPTFVYSSLIDSTTKLKSAITFDITDLLKDATTRAEIEANGLLMRVTDEAAYTGNEFASLITNDSATYPTDTTYAGFSPTVVIVPEPAVLGLAGGCAVVTLRRRRSA